MIGEGKKAPAVNLKDQDGKKVSLNEFKGKNIVLYFYPRNNTSGCTKEACNFRDDYSVYKDRDIEIIGISPDSVTSHEKFRSKSLTLLSSLRDMYSCKYGFVKSGCDGSWG